MFGDISVFVQSSRFSVCFRRASLAEEQTEV